MCQRMTSTQDLSCQINLASAGSAQRNALVYLVPSLFFEVVSPCVIVSWVVMVLQIAGQKKAF